MTYRHDPEQAMSALEKANMVRLPRADWKRRIARGEGSVRATIQEPPRYMQTATVKETLMAVHRVGITKARAICSRANVNPLRQLGELTAGERGRLLWAMEGVRMFKR